MTDCSLSDDDGVHDIGRMELIEGDSICDGYVQWLHYRCPACGYEADWDAVRRCQVGHWEDSPYWDPVEKKLSQELFEDSWDVD